MEVNKRSLGPPDPTQGAKSGGTPSKDQHTVRRFTWVIASISVHLEELRYFWGQRPCISGPQWKILMALAEIDQDDGVPVNAVSKKLHVDSSRLSQSCSRRRASYAEKTRLKTPEL